MNDLILQQNFLNMALFPFLYINKEFKAMCISKRTVRSFIRILITLTGCLAAAVLFFCNPGFAQVFCGIANSLAIPENVQPFVSLYLSILAVGTFSAITSRAITKTFCHVFFGDTDFYLTEIREKELEGIFRDQGYPVKRVTIRKVVNFCIKNLRKPPIKEFGSCPYDWKRVLDALIFEGDLEVFIEQQEFLQKKLRTTTKKCKALLLYGSTFDLDLIAEFNTPNVAQTGYGSMNDTTNNTASNFNAASNFNTARRISEDQTRQLQAMFSHQRITSPLSIQVQSSEPPLLEPLLVPALRTTKPSEFERATSQDSGFVSPKDQVLAIKVLTHFTKHFAKHCHHHNRQELLFYCTNQLKKRELQITEGIFPFPISPELTPLSTPESNSNSEKNSEKNSEDSNQDAVCSAKISSP